MHRKRSYLLIVLFILVFTKLNAQLIESFDSTPFPPDGWQIINNDGGNTWNRSSSTYHTAPGCAVCLWSETYLTNDDWLVTPRLHITAGDTFKFYYRTAEPVLETLEVRLSLKSTRVSDFNRILWARRNNNAGYVEVKLSLHQYIDSIVYIAFRYIVSYPLQPIGVGIYLDDISGPAVYSAHDAGVTQIQSPIGIMYDSIVTPAAKVTNFGSYFETIPVVFEISGEYVSHETIALSPGSDTIVNFSSCTLYSGNFNAVCYTDLTADADVSNDTAENSFIIRTNNVWQTLDSFPKIVKTNTSGLCNDGDIIYCLRTSDTSFYIYDINNNLWSRKKGPPIKPRTGLGVVYDNDGNIFLLPRYKKKFYKYSIAGNVWTDAESLPVKQKSYACLGQAGNYIYCLIGDTGFYRYSIYADTWERIKGTPVKLKSSASLCADSNGYLYLLRGSNKEFYRYSVSEDQWLIIDSVPIKVKKGAAITSDGYYIFCLPSGRSRKFFRYDSINKWTEVDSTPLPLRGGNALTFSKGKVFCLAGSLTRQFWAYHPGVAAISSSAIKTINSRFSASHCFKNEHVKSLSIYNASGQLIKKIENNNTSFLKNLGNGIYFLNFENENNQCVKNQKIIIIK